MLERALEPLDLDWDVGDGKECAGASRGAPQRGTFPEDDGLLTNGHAGLSLRCLAITCAKHATCEVGCRIFTN